MTATAILTAWVLGLSFGASACMLSCIPTLGVALLAEDGGSRSTMELAARFNAGRWLGYSLLGLVSGGIGASIIQGLNGEHAAWLFGAMLIFSGLMLWRRGASSACGRHGRQKDSMFKGSMFGLGLGMSLTPCVPLTAVCASAAATGSLLGGWALGASFGFGAVLPAQLALGYGLGAAGQQVRRQLAAHASQLGRVAGALLVVLGVGAMVGLVRL
ncbi:MAG: sulfite exporter TauE/SafE family protein [Zetaproteobacteria bacterium]|nr:MAG: sulfite exporter TauE/SafE family protein [Zetaproteobacteria bacterium]